MASSAPPMPAQGPLAGIRALDLTTNATAYSGRLIADLGAEVIRIEPPSGDPVRRAPPHVRGAEGTTVSAAHAFLNANKKSVSLDLASADGRHLFGDLVARSHLVLECFPPGTLDAWGIGYQAMRERNPEVILVSITPFGQSGPRAAEHASDLTLLAAGGLLSLGGYVDAGPVAVPGDQGHIASAIFGAIGALTALLEHESTGRGQWIDVSAQECIAFALEDAIPEWYLNRSVRQRYGERAREAGTGVYPCKDGYVSMVAGRLGTQKAFAALAKWIAEAGTPGGRELLAEEWQDFAYRQSCEGIARFEAIFGTFCAARGKQELYRDGQRRQIAIAPVNTVADVLDNEQLSASGFFRNRFDPEIGRDLIHPGPPYRLHASPAEMRSAAPRVGEHNRDILVGELGVSEAAFDALVSAGIV